MPKLLLLRALAFLSIIVASYYVHRHFFEGKGVLLCWDAKKHAIVQSPFQPGLSTDGDVRDVISLPSARNEQLLVISKNNEPNLNKLNFNHCYV
jgi:hypothetical protein